ncbi:zinc finger BED domain-containing protein 6-like [Pistacia vera]|uniref:zinc finger BED domain-containing protein 6-like n=1 Tax=Pistacia vera TaxID=55513 RepID=UPI00126302F7|nr:zinc finger BED domain-containing protein 6-like [Pistacia vera]
MAPSMRSVLAGKDAKWRANMSVAQFFYDACIPMNALNSIYFQPMLDVAAAIGPGYKQPTYDAMRVNLLRDAKKEVPLLVDNYKSIWEEVGCTLMADGWIDTSDRSLINFLVYCPKGVCFIKSVDASDVVKDVFTLFKLFEEMTLWVGPNNIVHVVMDNGANFKAVGRMLSEKYENITWSPCVAHCINLILKDISELDHIVHLAKRASKVTKFVYNHTILIPWLRKREGWKEIIRSGAPQFATTFIALRSLHEHKHDLQAMYDRATVCKKPEVKHFLDVVDNIASAFKLNKTKLVDESKLYRDRKKSFSHELAFQTCKTTRPGCVIRKEGDELNLDELEQALYEEGSIPIGVGDQPYYDLAGGSQDCFPTFNQLADGDYNDDDSDDDVDNQFRIG